MSTYKKQAFFDRRDLNCKLVRLLIIRPLAWAKKEKTSVMSRIPETPMFDHVLSSVPKTTIFRYFVKFFHFYLNALVKRLYSYLFLKIYPKKRTPLSSRRCFCHLDLWERSLILCYLPHAVCHLLC